MPAWHCYSTVTIGVLVASRLYELAFHGWDVRATASSAAQIRPELGPFLVGVVRQLLPAFCIPEAGINTSCQFEVDGQTWVTRIAEGKLEEVSNIAEPEAVVRTDASTFLLLATERRTLADCADRVAIERARDRAEQVLSVSRFRV